MVEDRHVFILGDTSYGSCCVDEVAASHIEADGIIHFGRACLSPCVNSYHIEESNIVSGLADYQCFMYLGAVG